MSALPLPQVASEFHSQRLLKFNFVQNIFLIVSRFQIFNYDFIIHLSRLSMKQSNLLRHQLGYASNI